MLVLFESFVRHKALEAEQPGSWILSGLPQKQLQLDIWELQLGNVMYKLSQVQQAFN